MNGEPLPAIHGGPVRLITPGFYATMNIKWVSGLRLEAHETFNHHQLDRYRTPIKPIKPGEPFTNTFANSEPNWPMRTKSMIFAPLERESLQSGLVEVSGVAFNDGAAKITSVEVSVDGGQSWHRAGIEHTQSPYGWQPWRTKVKLGAGKQQISCRATDALGRSQPVDGAIFWNPSGYTWNGIHTVNVQIG